MIGAQHRAVPTDSYNYVCAHMDILHVSFLFLSSLSCLPLYFLYPEHMSGVCMCVCVRAPMVYPVIRSQAYGGSGQGALVSSLP